VSQFADAGLVGLLLSGRWTMRVQRALIHKGFAAEIEDLYR
jgi:hypothetical protein